MKIPETKININQMIGWIVPGINNAIEDFEDDPSPDDLVVISGNARDLIGYKLIADLETDIDGLYYYLYLMIQCRCNLFTLCLSNQEEEIITVDTVNRPASTTGAKERIGATKWSEGFLASMLEREENAIKLLSKVPTTDLKAAHYKIENFALSYIDFLKSIGTKEALTNLAKVKNDLKAHTIVTDEEVKCLSQPKMDLWTAILNRDQQNFNALLEAAVSGHNAFYRQEIDDNGGDSYRTNDPNGYFALELTAIAAYAHDQGMKVTYESDYLPRFLIEGYMKIDAKVTMPGV